MTLPQVFLTTPIAHRGFHAPGVPENSLAAARAAIEAGYGIECDIQPAADGTPMVFHDYDMARLTGQAGFIARTSPADLAALRLTGSDEKIPTLAEFLDLVAGRVPLLIEIKDQDGRLGPDVGDLPARVAQALEGYDGPVALMSFSPDTVAAFHAAAPAVPVGLTTCDYAEADWPQVPAERREALSLIVDYDRVGACFISHSRGDLGNPRVDALRADGAAVLTWTIRSPEQEAEARKVAQNITFEGYAA